MLEFGTGHDLLDDYQGNRRHGGAHVLNLADAVTHYSALKILCEIPNAMGHWAVGRFRRSEPD